MNVEEFRSGLREWLDENDLTPGPDHSLQGHMQQFARVSRALYDADWMRYGWPVEVGGLGGPALLRAIVGEEVVGPGVRSFSSSHARRPARNSSTFTAWDGRRRAGARSRARRCGG